MRPALYTVAAVATILTALTAYGVVDYYVMRHRHKTRAAARAHIAAMQAERFGADRTWPDKDAA
jgi:hypothetical protein